MIVELILSFLDIVCAIEIVVSSPQIVRDPWAWSIPKITNIYDYISNDSEFKLLARIELNTFKYILKRMDRYLNWPRNWYHNVDFNAKWYPYKKQRCALSNANRLLRYLMWGSGKSVSGLCQLFGQKKSTTYYDIHHISMMIVKVLSNEWISMPKPGTLEYKKLLGLGVLSDGNDDAIFPLSPYIMDVCCVCIYLFVCLFVYLFVYNIYGDIFCMFIYI